MAYSFKITVMASVFEESSEVTKINMLIRVVSSL